MRHHVHQLQPTAAVGMASWFSAGLLIVALAGVRPAHAEPALRTEAVRAQGQGAGLVLDGTLEARQDARVAAQVSGRITAVLVKAGDVVRAGQPLVRIDATLAVEQLAASQAQQAQAEAMLRAAQAEFERARTLLAKGYISPAAMDQARAQFQAAQAGADALRAQARATGTQAGFHVVKAPYAARVMQVPVSEGDLAAPGVPLVMLFSAQSLRVSVSVPESEVARLDLQAPARISLPHAAGQPGWDAGRPTVLPGLDPVTHAATVRVDLPESAAPAAAALGPGQLARVALGLQAASGAVVAEGLSIPSSAVVQRGEVPAVYVVDAQGVPRLRQVRLGRTHDGRVDVAAGLQAGERVATEPLVAARRLP